jgi:hypothetical protein
VEVSEAGKSDRFFRIPHLFQQVTSLPPEAYRNLRVMKIDADNVQRASLTIDGKERFTLEREGADWRVMLHGKAVGKGSDDAGRFVNRLSTLRAVGVRAEGFSAEECAAMKARAVLTVQGVGEKEETVRFDYGRRGNLKACSTLGTQQFEVHHDLLPFLDVPLLRVVGK